MPKILRTFIVLASVVCLILSVGCTRHPNEKQLQSYDEQLKATNAAEELLQEKKQEKADLERELEKKQQQLEDAKSEKEKVKNRLDDM